MNKLCVLVSVLLLFAACRKRHDKLYGTLNISGTVTDLVSGAILPVTAVKLYKVKLTPGPFGSSPDRETEEWLIDTTDNEGRYQFNIEAKGQYGFDLVADPAHPLYVSSDLSIGRPKRIEQIGDQICDLSCNRSAYARIDLVNIGSRTTSYAMALSTEAQDIVVNNFSRDTTVYLKLVGNTDFKNDIRFTINDEHIDEHHTVSAAPWDTVSLRLNF